MKINSILFLVVFVTAQFCNAQNIQHKNIFNPLSRNFAITTEGGVTLGQTDYKTDFDNLKLKYLFKGSLEYYFFSKGMGLFSIRAFGGTGIVAGNDATRVPTSFNTTIYYAGGGIGYTFSISDVVYPYLAAGFTSTWYTPKDNNNNDLPKFSTKPMGAYLGEVGFRFMVSQNISLNLSGQMFFYTKDYLDNVISGPNNDAAITGTVGLSYYFGRDNDQDNDGVYDYEDACPNTPPSVKVDAFGCPLDSDGDGVPDYLDRCSNTPKGVKVDANGCPSDADGDGVPDYLDKCANTPAGVHVDSNGCPIDSDGDGVPDYLDKCPNTPKGIKVDTNGCPLDSDGDGVPDYLDKCPNTPQGVQVDSSGCPIQKPEVRRFILKGDANFQSGKSELLPNAYQSLDSLAKSMKENPNFKWAVEGYTDSRGSEKSNLKLSEARAQSVVNYLINRGVERSSLVVKAFGESNPIVPNNTAENRAMNRRVEIKIISENK